MKLTKSKISWLRTLIFCVCLIVSWGFVSPIAFAKDVEIPDDSSAIINFYNTAGNFIYHPVATVHANEREMRAGLLYDLESKKIVWQKEMNNAYPIASLTKMMVALLTVEDIHAGKINWTDQVHWTRDIVIGRGKKKHIAKEEINYSLYDIFKAAMIASNNEAAEQMAHYVGGDVQTFVERMNTRARELNMNSTFYGNPTGLPAISKAFDNSSTPTDLLLLTLEMLRYNEILTVTGMGYADIGNGRSTSVIRNHNHLTIDYKGEVDGMKTGYTKRAGFCLVATSNKCDHRLISIVLGARSPNLRNEVVKDMINDYYSSIGLDKLGPYCNAPSYPMAANASASADESKTVKQIYTVKRGDDISSIAYQFNCTPADVKKWNKLRSGRVVPGKQLTIISTVAEKNSVAKNNEEDTEGSEQLNSSSDQSLNTEVATETVSTAATPDKTKTKTKPAADPATKYIIYVVQPGDTLFSIAKRYELPNISQLKAVNKISSHHLLRVGAKIKVPVNV